ncbi:hypothetical protein OYC64_019313 [Pagothenia borchgrevinki]|uniref:Secreted protein n=1 Tax=Pagothenia borchgrevinki TaxID=8213 RepID=A0ABD2GT58_PAGBO
MQQQPPPDSTRLCVTPQSLLWSLSASWAPSSPRTSSGRRTSALLSLHDLYASRTLRRAGKIVADPSHPEHKVFVPLPSGRRLRSIRTKTSLHLNSFFPSATGLINKARDPH